MRKILTLGLMAAFMLSATGIAPALAEEPSLNGQIVKLEGQSTLYYIGLDGRRYVFPNENTFRSWFVDFSNVKTISAEELSHYSLSGNVTYRPGVHLIKIQTDPKVYAVGNNGMLRWVKTEKIAKKLYGDAWNQIIDDISAAFFANYTMGQEIDDENEFDPDSEIENARTIDDSIQKIKDQIKQLKEDIKELQKQVRALANSERKVLVCHKPGNHQTTIIVSKSGLRAHLAHGDTEGRCGRNDNDDDDTTDTTAPVISNINVTTSTSTATITWSTNESSDSSIRYATSSLATANPILEKSNSNKVTSHSLLLTDLNPNTTYYFVVKSKDNSNNTASSTQQTFTTNNTADVIAPVISNINTDAATSTATITWTTNETSNSAVDYATSSLATANPVLTKSNSSQVTSHSIVLIGLTPNTMYHYRVKSSDGAGNTATSTESTFTTESLPDVAAPILSNISVDASANSALITWLTNELSNSSVSYATSSLATANPIFTESSSTLLLSHSLQLNSLTASTTYFFILSSKDGSNNTASSTQQSFTTD